MSLTSASVERMRDDPEAVLALVEDPSLFVALCDALLASQAALKFVADGSCCCAPESEPEWHACEACTAFGALLPRGE